MTKYTEQFKLAVVEQYLTGAAGFVTVAHQHSLGYSMVNRWVNLYRAHGLDGLKKKFSHYSAEFKLSVLKHMWDNELSYGQVTATFNIRNAGIVSVWERRYRSGGVAALMPCAKGRPKKMPTPPAKPMPPPDDENRPRDELLAELNYLRMENAYLKKLQALVQAQQKATPPKKRK